MIMTPIFKICDRCKGTNVTSLKRKLKELDPTATIDIRCHNLCGIGRDKPFVIVGHIPVIADNETELLAKVADLIQTKKKALDCDDPRKLK